QVPVPPSGLGVALNEGEGLFADSTQQTLGFSLQRLAAGDLVGDGSIDVAALSPYDSLAAVFPGDGTGALGAAQTAAAPVAVAAFALDDRDGDGKLDIVLAGEDQLLELRGHDGALGEPRCFVLAGEEPERAGPGDPGGDGLVDAAVALRFSDTVNVLLGDGAGAFGPAASFDTGADGADVGLADLDGDGDLDLVVGLIYPSRLERLLNDGHGALGPPLTFP